MYLILGWPDHYQRKLFLEFCFVVTKANTVCYPGPTIVLTTLGHLSIPCALDLVCNHSQGTPSRAAGSGVAQSKNFITAHYLFLTSSRQSDITQRETWGQGGEGGTTQSFKHFHLCINFQGLAPLPEPSPDTPQHKGHSKKKIECLGRVSFVPQEERHTFFHLSSFEFSVFLTNR